MAGKPLGENPQSAAVIWKVSTWLRACLAKETDMWRFKRLPCGDGIAVGQRGGYPIAAPTSRRSCGYSAKGTCLGQHPAGDAFSLGVRVISRRTRVQAARKSVCRCVRRCSAGESIVLADLGDKLPALLSTASLGV